jgi:SagB-type dehydrogenase family enzyme
MVRNGGRTIAILVPLSSEFTYRTTLARPLTRYVLSRFAYCRRSANELIVESPLAAASVLLPGAAGASCLAALAVPCRASDVSAAAGIPKAEALKFLNLLCNAGALTGVDANGNPLENRDQALFSWEFHDLLFHSRSRVGRHGNPYGRQDAGGVLPDAGTERTGESYVDLARPDIQTLRKKDLPFTEVVERRRSRRVYGASAISAVELGEFLFRASRVCRVQVDGNIVERRPYPCSGASYELELYPVVGACRGLKAGLYRYDPSAHRLFRISGRTPTVSRILKSAGAPARIKQPQLVIVAGARFRRVSLHYRSIAYASILKDVGALFQTFYLVASAMNLSACALGTGNSDLFAEAAGLNYYAETSVGEFLLGSA